MIENKTLGQVYFEAYNAATSDWEAAGIAAVAEVVARRVLAEREPAKPVAASKSVRVRVYDVVDEVTGDVRLGCDVIKPEAASEAGDWATSAWISAYENWHKKFAPYCEGASCGQSADIIREAAERHYGAITEIGSVRYYEQQLENLRQGIDKLAKERDSYRELFNDAVAHVDGVFQVDSKNPAPLLPDFLPLGANKFEGVKQLAMAYIAATTNRIDALKERDAAVAEVERLRAELKVAESKCNWELQVGPNMTPVVVQKSEPALSAKCTRLLAEKITDHVSTNAIRGCSDKDMATTVGRMLVEAMQPSAPPSPAADATGADDKELRVIVRSAIRYHFPQISESDGEGVSKNILAAIRPLFDAVRAERDEAISDRDVWKKSYLNMVEGEPAKNSERLYRKAVDDCRQLRQRAEAAEAERDIAQSNAAELGNSLLAMTDEREQWFKQHDALEDKWNSFYRRVGGYLSRLKKSFGITGDLSDEAIVDAAIAERDKLAAELREVREAVEEIAWPNYEIVLDGNWKIMRRGESSKIIREPTRLGAILAAWRATKGKEQGDGK